MSQSEAERFTEGLKKMRALLEGQNVPPPFMVWASGMDAPMRVDSPEYRQWLKDRYPEPPVTEVGAV